MSTADATQAIRDHLHAIGAAAQTAAEALDGRLDLPEGVLAGIAAELGTLAGLLGLILNRLAEQGAGTTQLAGVVPWPLT
jgi:hypothetical protein